MMQWLQMMCTTLARKLECWCDLLTESLETVMQCVDLLTVVLVTQQQADLLHIRSACSMMLSMHCLLYWCILPFGPSAILFVNVCASAGDT
jgi:hypothetical protein